MERKQPFIGLVLAGGLSSRMGTDKSQLQLDGYTLQQRSVKLLQSLGASQVLISKNDFAPESLPDIYPKRGPLSGIHAGLFHSELPILCIPVDMPFATAPMLNKLLLTGMAMQKCSHYNNHPLPLFIPNNDLCRESLEAILEDTNSRCSVKSFLSLVGSAPIRTSEQHSLTNVNTPEQWRAVLYNTQLAEKPTKQTVQR